MASFLSDHNYTKKKRRTGWYCCVAECTNCNSRGYTLHSFPKNKALRRQWIKFVQTCRRNFGPKYGTPNEYSFVCEKHFSPDCYPLSLRLKRSMGLKVKPTLVPGSVPTIQKPGRVVTSGSNSGTASTHARSSTSVLSPVGSVLPGVSRVRGAYAKREHQRKQKSTRSMKEDSPDQPSTVYSTVQPMSDSTSGSLLSLKRGRVCQRCSAAFVLVSSLELHLASVHGEPLPFPEWTESPSVSSDLHSVGNSNASQTSQAAGPPAERSDHVKKECTCANAPAEFSVKQEPAWSLKEEDSPDQPSAVYSTQPMSDNTYGSLLSLNARRMSQPSAVYSTAQPMSDNTSGSLLSLNARRMCQPSALYSTAQPMPDNTSWSLLSHKTGCVCQHCSAAFVLVSSLELHLASVHGEFTLDMVLPGSSAPDRERECICSTAQPMSDNTSPLSLNTSHACQRCSAAFVLVSSLELHLASVHGEFTLDMALPGFSLPDRCDAGNRSNTDIDNEEERDGSRRETTKRKVNDNDCGNTDCDADRDVCDADNCIHTDVDKKEDSDSSRIETKKRKVNDIDTGNDTDDNDTCNDILDSDSSNDILDNDTSSEDGSYLDWDPDECDAGERRDPKDSDWDPEGCNDDVSCESDTISSESDSELDSSGKRHTTSKKKVKSTAGKRSRKHVCDVCGKCLSENYGLKRHKRIHSGYKPFVCDVCLRSFAQSSTLNAHRLTHSSDKPFVCDVCSKSFTHAYILREHKRVHTGERPYKCPHCEKGFRQSCYLRRHVKSVHESARPHVCDVCGAAFSDKGRLLRHRRIHTGEMPYVCSECGQVFNQSNNLKHHLLTHSDHKPHSCPHCPAAFRWSVTLKTHVQKMHQ